jgi:hypothetical protein
MPYHRVEEGSAARGGGRCQLRRGHRAYTWGRRRGELSRVLLGGGTTVQVTVAVCAPLLLPVQSAPVLVHFLRGLCVCLAPSASGDRGQACHWPTAETRDGEPYHLSTAKQYFASIFRQAKVCAEEIKEKGKDLADLCSFFDAASSWFRHIVCLMEQRFFNFAQS